MQQYITMYQYCYVYNANEYPQNEKVIGPPCLFWVKKETIYEGVNGVPLKSVISKILAKKSVISKI